MISPMLYPAVYLVIFGAVLIVWAKIELYQTRKAAKAHHAREVALAERMRRFKMAQKSEYVGVGLNALTGFLREAKAAHTSFEKLHGADPHWEPFYAEYIRSRLYGMSETDAYQQAVIGRLGDPHL